MPSVSAPVCDGPSASARHIFDCVGAPLGQSEDAAWAWRVSAVLSEAPFGPASTGIVVRAR